jgi:carbamoyl-phosphate synthase large subunit
VSVRDQDKAAATEIARDLHGFGFEIVATHGTAVAVEAAGIPCKHINKVKEGRPHIVDLIKNDEIALIINTTEGKSAIADSFTIRREALNHRVAYATTIACGRAMCLALSYPEDGRVSRLQDLHQEIV